MANDKISILLIEPDIVSSEIFIKHIRFHLPEITLHTAHNRLEAMGLLQEEEIDAVICDAFLTGCDRMLFVAELCAERPGLPIMIITTDTTVTMNSVPPAARNLCVKVIIHKPLDLDKFLDGIKALVNELTAERTSLSPDSAT